ncbi:DUF6207 family protein [Streptomyces sp. NPDC101115]|uniref:DUF6207 family protein n=1 Tax=Streptomyces sp. NPDC101115 TaxID=3366106 RepID=UPI0038147EC7
MVPACPAGTGEATVQAAVAEVARRWATSGSPQVRRIPGEPGVTARMYADLRRPGISRELTWDAGG